MDDVAIKSIQDIVKTYGGKLRTVDVIVVEGDPPSSQSLYFNLNSDKQSCTLTPQKAENAS